MLNDIIGTLSFLQPGLDDDFIDRLNYYHTSTFLIVLAILVSFKMLAGRPLECWVPAEYTGSWEDYSEVYCWAQNTYYIPFDTTIPREVADREFQMVSYYQWLPFFLIIIALAFYFPCIIWRLFNSKSGVVLNDIVAVAKDRENIEPDEREKNIKGIGDHLLSIFRHQFHLRTHHGSLHRVARCFNVRYYEAYMISLYFFVKLLYFTNSFGQLFLMNQFLQTDEDYTVYGYGVVRDLLSGKGWHESGNFPRVTMCDMQIRVLGNVQRHTVQCVLVINIFTEKIFILLWIWFTILSAINLFGLLYWISCSILLTERKRFVLRQLGLADAHFDHDEHKHRVSSFVKNWLKMDGVFVLRIITLHSGLMFCMELVDYMWDEFVKHEEEALELIDKANAQNHHGRTRRDDLMEETRIDLDDVDGDGKCDDPHNESWEESPGPFPLPAKTSSYSNPSPMVSFY